MKKTIIALLAVTILLGGCSFFEESNDKSAPPNKLSEINPKPGGNNSSPVNNANNLNKSYRDASGWSIRYPDTWREERDPSKLEGANVGFIDIKGTKFNQNILVYRVQAPPNYTVEHAATELMNNVRSSGGNVQVSAVMDTTLGGQRAKAFSLNNGQVGNYKVFTVSNGYVYVINFTDISERFNSSMTLGQSIIQTFSLR